MRDTAAVALEPARDVPSSRHARVRDAACPVCQARVFRLYREVASTIREVPDGLDRPRSVQARIERCARCGLYRTIPSGDDQSPEQLYREASVCFNASLSKVQVAGTRCVSSVDELSLLTVRPPARLLDIGCGAGQFLWRAVQAGYRASGIDPDPRAVSFARAELGLDARCVSLDQFPTDEPFDVVAMFGVLEHIAEPRAWLHAVRQRLSPGGELLVGLPNVASLNRWISRLGPHDWDMFLEPGHLYHYDIRTLTALAARVGLRLRRWVTGTITIRGKVPFLPVRSVPLERRVQRLVERHGAVRGLYLAGLRCLDRVRAGDMLLAIFYS